MHELQLKRITLASQRKNLASACDQAVPLTSLYPLLEGCQHPLCPYRQFDQAPLAHELSGASHPFGYCLRLEFCQFEHCVSTFLHPLAPPELPGFSATMGAVTPGRLALRLPVEREHPLWRRPGLPALGHRTVRSFRLQPPPVVPASFWGLARRAYRTTLRWPPFGGRASLGLRHWGAGSPRRLAESSLLVFRTNRSPPVASHPASRRRSYPWLQDARTSRQGLSPCGFDALTGAHPCRLARQVKQVGS